MYFAPYSKKHITRDNMIADLVEKRKIGEITTDEYFDKIVAINTHDGQDFDLPGDMQQ